MDVKYEKYITMAVIFLFVFGISLSFAFKTDKFANSESYSELRQIENIKEKGTPLFYDDLSYSGRVHILLPLFHYIVAFLSLFIPIIAASKIIPSFFLALITVVVYYIAFHLTKNRIASGLSALISGFVPILFSFSVTTLSDLSLSVFLILLCVYYFINLLEKPYHFLTCFVILLITTPLSMIFVLVLIFYIGLSTIDKMKIEREEYEITIFLIFLTSWFLFIIFKKALLAHGITLFWHNLPEAVINEYFVKTNILLAITQIGAIPFLFGLYTIHKHTFETKNKPVTLVLSFIAVSFICLWFNIITPEIGLSLLGIMMVIIMSSYFKLFILHIEKFKMNLKAISFFLIILFFLATSVYPSLYFASKSIENFPKEETFQSMEWIRRNTEQNSVILTHPKLGTLVNYVAQRKNVADTDFLMIKNPDEIWKDIEKIYSSRYATEAVELMTKYDVDYVLISDLEEKEFVLGDYFDTSCFKLVYSDKVKIYKSECRIKTIH